MAEMRLSFRAAGRSSLVVALTMKPMLSQDQLRAIAKTVLSRL